MNSCTEKADGPPLRCLRGGGTAPWRRSRSMRWRAAAALQPRTVEWKSPKRVTNPPAYPALAPSAAARKEVEEGHRTRKGRNSTARQEEEPAEEKGVGTRLTPMPAVASMTEMRMINLPMLPAPRPNGGAPHFHLMATAQRTRAQRPPPQTQRGNMHYGERVLNAGMLHYRVISAAKAHVHIGSMTAATCCIPDPLDARSPAMETNGIATLMMPAVRHADHVVPSVHNVVRLTSLGMVRK